MLFPHVYCTENGQICHFTAGEGEINAAASTISLALSDKFDLSHTYWLLGGIGGVNPKHASLGSVAFGRFAVQVALQYEIDSRDVPEDWKSGYFSYGSKRPDEYPTTSYGSEVFELNDNLRDVAVKLATKGNLTDSTSVSQYRAKYAGTPGNMYKLGTQPPSVMKCDMATSDVYFSGQRLGDAFDDVMKVWTNGTAKYCMSAQEDTAVLEGLLRGAVEKRIDFSRIMLLRAGSNFDRAPPGSTDYKHLAFNDQNAFEVSVANSYIAGVEVVRGIVDKWNCTFSKGIKPTNYIGDIFGSLGGQPDFGLGSITDGKGYLPSGSAPQRHKAKQGARRRHAKML